MILVHYEHRDCSRRESISKKIDFKHLENMMFSASKRLYRVHLFQSLKGGLKYVFFG